MFVVGSGRGNDYCANEDGDDSRGNNKLDDGDSGGWKKRPKQIQVQRLQHRRPHLASGVAFKSLASAPDHLVRFTTGNQNI